MPPSARLDRFVVGHFGSYEVPTVKAIDAELKKLWAKLDAADPIARPRIRSDMDKLLDRRVQLQQEAT